MTEYFTTREVAEFLRIKERKVYDLAASGKIPCSKAMGKLLFPKDEIEAWVAGKQTGTQTKTVSTPRPDVFLGSHDPLLEWALRESRCGLAVYFDGSVDGLRRLNASGGVGAGIHLYDGEHADWNTPAVLGACAKLPVALIEWARRSRGLIVSPHMRKAVRGLADLDRFRFAGRQEDAGAQRLLADLLEAEGRTISSLATSVLARSETDAALAVLEGRADVSFGLKTLASQYKLAFVPIIEERFDLLIDRRAWFEPPLQTFIAFCQSDAFRARARELEGYDVSGLGRVRFNGP